MKVISDKTNPSFPLVMFDETIFHWGQGQTIYYCIRLGESTSPVGDNVMPMSLGLDSEGWEMVDLESIWWGGNRWGLRRPQYSNAHVFECTRMFGSETEARKNFIQTCYSEIRENERRNGNYRRMIQNHEQKIANLVIKGAPDA